MSSEYCQKIGTTLAVTGSILSIIGILVNNLWLDHTLAMYLWLFSNPALALWAIGVWQGYWDGGLSIKAITVMYLIAFVSGAVGLFYGGIRG